MTFLIIFRMVVDYFWGVKLLSVAHSSFAGFLLVKRLGRGVLGGFCSTDIALMVFLVLVLLNYMVYMGGNLVDFVKLLSVPLFWMVRFS
jgi:hypothetical protein